MALIKCPDCGKEFSDSAVACPNCGRPHKQAQPVEVRKKSSGCLGLGCLAVILIGIIVSQGASNARREATVADTAVAKYLAKPTTSGSPAAADAWTISREVSKMDDSKTVTLSLGANNAVTGWLDTKTPELHIRCKEHSTDVWVYTGMSTKPEYGEYDRFTVRLRLDDRAAFSEMWNESTDSKAMFAPSPISIARRLAKAKRLRLSFTPFNASPATAEFTLAGIEKHLPEVAKTCGWSL
jgi:type VI secretion system protein VasI